MEQTTVAAWDESGEPAGRWWLPIVVGLAALALLGLLVLGIWLFNRDDGAGGPVPSGSPTVTAPATPTAEPTTEPPTTSPSVTPTTAEPTAVAVPPLTGLSQAQARGQLDRLGLTYRIEFRASDQPRGTVIGTEPGAGTSVALGDQVTLVVSDGPGVPPSTAQPGPTASSVTPPAG